MKILVTGAGGMVGGYFPEVFRNHKLVLSDIDDLDVRDPDAVFQRIERENPDVVYHLAAQTDVDRCELNVDDSFMANTLGTQNVALACQKYDKTLVYISTAGVFGGKKREPYTEFDSPNPVNVYGKTKLEGERIVSALLRKYYVVRAGWMFGGGSKKDKKFIYKMISLSETKNVINVVNDKCGSPTYGFDLVRGLKELVATGYFGLYHMTNTGVCSRYDIACEIFRIIRRDVTVVPVPSSHFPLPAPRASSEAMRNMKLELLGLNQMRSWQAALSEYLADYIHN